MVDEKILRDNLFLELRNEYFIVIDNVENFFWIYFKSNRENRKDGRR